MAGMKETKLQVGGKPAGGVGTGVVAECVVVGEVAAKEMMQTLVGGCFIGRRQPLAGPGRAGGNRFAHRVSPPRNQVRIDGIARHHVTRRRFPHPLERSEYFERRSVALSHRSGGHRIRRVFELQRAIIGLQGLTHSPIPGSTVRSVVRSRNHCLGPQLGGDRRNFADRIAQADNQRNTGRSK